jgi:ribosomal protein S12 methylthiotransferase
MVSLGCPKNLVDSEKMLALLAGGPCVVNAPLGEADVIIVNTCAFLSSAREESLGVIREAVALKRTGRARRVVVAGCLTTRDGEGLYEQVPGIDAIVGVNDRQAILAAVTGRGLVTRHAVYGGGIASDAGRFRLTPPHTAYLRIAEGCSRRCSFCTIPSIRGPFRSKPPRMVLREARELVASGAAELNLIAQDTTSYGVDLRMGGTGQRGTGLTNPQRRRIAIRRLSQHTRGSAIDESGGGGTFPKGPTLASLLRRLDRIDGVRWIRLMYAYPHLFTDDLIGAVAECPNVVKYVDIPLQHISDGVLKRMRRNVRRQQIERLLENLRRRVPGVVIRTTFIVGFPGERERDFQELREFVREFRFDALGVFEFSPEEGTPAATMPGAVPAKIKAERAREIMLLQKRIAQAANRRKVGSRVEVLVDGVDSAGQCFGRYYGQAPDIDSVCLLTGRADAGSFVRGRVVSWKGYDLVVAPL